MRSPVAPWFLLAAGLSFGCSNPASKASPGAGAAASNGDNKPGGGGTSGITLELGGTGTGGSATATPNPAAPQSIDRTHGLLPDALVDQLTKGGNAAAMAFLYPYDQTVFPGGILPPVLQWSATTASSDGIYLHLHSQAFDYREVFAGNSTASQALPVDAWNAAASQSLGASDPVTVELTTISGSVVSGPISQQWIFARGQLKSAIYYNTYDSAAVVPNNGAVMRILPLAPQPEVIKTAKGTVPLGPCYSCHSLSANGQTLVAQRHQYPGGPYTSEAFDVVANPGIDPPSMSASTAGNEDWGFSALYPDGSKVLTAGEPGATDQPLATFPFAPQNNPGMIGPRSSQLVDARSGVALPATGLVKYAMMPSFSADGSKVVFNDYDNGQGHSLAIMDFDNATNTFSNRTEIFRDSTLFPGWPFFAPDAKKVAFALGDGSDFATAQDPPLWLKLNHSDLYVVDSAGGAKAVLLELASGVPLKARDQRLNYYPTMSPIAAGGYFWLFFTSKRSYGNVMVQPETDPKTKKIWVSAIDIETGTADPSHPAFYLPGQELKSGNIRAFATLSPCHSEGNSCQTGIDCCTGFCVDGMCGAQTGCAGFEDKCTTTADCCPGPGIQCLGGFCGKLVK